MRDAIVQCVQTQFTASGVGVASCGEGNVVLDLPADFPGMSALIETLSTRFGAECDLTTIGHAPRLTVWHAVARTPTMMPAAPSEADAAPSDADAAPRVHPLRPWRALSVGVAVTACAAAIALLYIMVA